MPTRFYWRKKYREGRLGKVRSSNLLPVAVSEIPSNKSGQVRCVFVSRRATVWGRWKSNYRKGKFASRTKRFLLLRPPALLIRQKMRQFGTPKVRVQQGSKTRRFWKVFGGLIEIRAIESTGLRV
jgi:hypothetical protein